MTFLSPTDWSMRQVVVCARAHTHTRTRTHTRTATLAHKHTCTRHARTHARTRTHTQTHSTAQHRRKFGLQHWSILLISHSRVISDAEVLCFYTYCHLACLYLHCTVISSALHGCGTSTPLHREKSDCNITENKRVGTVLLYHVQDFHHWPEGTGIGHDTGGKIRGHFVAGIKRKRKEKKKPRP